ncbi:MAG TPA: Rne/Rng family ribonuclease [Rhizobiaceae bacterium]|nr:Rne/Rng family ribonuclease [Rhizobiaceae bacterium]
MPNKMLIDASHPEETRVVVTRGNRIEEFDFESQDKKQLKGNIYLARVTRVEPSLQAAFVEYGGNRHGFLAFNEIHPDYYQIPVADRQALLRAEAEAAKADEEDEQHEEDRSKRGARRRGRGRGRAKTEVRASEQETSASEETSGDADVSTSDAATEDGNTPGEFPTGEFTTEENSSSNEDGIESGPESAGEANEDDHDGGTRRTLAESVEADVVSETAESVESDGNGDSDENGIESVGAEDALEEIRTRRRPPRRQYKIQEVIKRRQILLVQVVKEERGNKGAALTTYLSLAGRYSVLMPNTARGGGISRKITNAQDRKRLKDVVKDLDVPEGMGVILRTAGENRTKAEIKRDYEYLMRLWENVRNLTLQSTAPALVYEEGSLIKRSVRDLYNKDIDEILVSGEEGYREAKDFMRMLMPSHAKVVQPYRDPVPIFARQGIEAQLDRMLQPQVTLKSGGYIIINQTEALVAIDVNSGRSTREHSIEDTALQTNLEAADEVARQLRLRDMAGLIVIDFIDMEENRNNRAVEKRLKDCLKNDRARIQVGRISHFGLMEMSRQRIRASVLESTMKPCPHCGGTGHVRSDSSVALHVVRAIEEHLLKDGHHHITVHTPAATALYVLNHKRANLTELENRFGLTISIEADETLGAQHYSIVKGAAVERKEGGETPLDTPAFEAMEIDDAQEDTSDHDVEAEGAEQGDHHRKRRRKRRRRGRDHAGEEHTASTSTSEIIADADEQAFGGEEDAESNEVPGGPAAEGESRKRRRGKRGGRRNKHDLTSKQQSDQESGTFATQDEETLDVAEMASATSGVALPVDETTAAGPEEVIIAALAEAAPESAVQEEVVKTPRRRVRKTKVKAAEDASQAETDETAKTEASKAEPEAPAEVPEPATVTEEVEASAGEEASQPSVPVVTSSGQSSKEEARPRKSGWWQRKGFF